MMPKQWLIDLERKQIRERNRYQAKNNPRIDDIPYYDAEDFRAFIKMYAQERIKNCGFLELEFSTFNTFLSWLDKDDTPWLDYVDVLLRPVEALPLLVNDTNPFYKAASKWRMKTGQ